MLWGLAGGSALVAGVAAVAERRRSKRRDLDSVGWVPWTGVLVTALFVALIAGGLAIKG